MLLSVTVADQQFKTMQATGAVNFAGIYAVDPPDGDTGRLGGYTTSMKGTIVYDSPAHGVLPEGWGSASGKGTLQSTNTLFIRGPFTFKGQGTGEDNGGVLSGHGGGIASLTVKHFGTFTFEGGGGGTGTLDVSNFNVTFGFHGGNEVASADMDAAGKLKPSSSQKFDIAMGASWVTAGTPEDGVHVRVQVSGPVHKAPSHTTPFTNIQAYWAKGNKIVGEVSDTIPIYWNLASGNYVIDSLPTPPAEATQLLLKVKVDGTTRQFALPLKSTPPVAGNQTLDALLTVDKNDWLPDGAGGKISVTSSDILHLVSEQGGGYGYSKFFDGDLVGLNSATEAIDAFMVLSTDGSVVISTTGAYVVSTIQEAGEGSGELLCGTGEDLLQFTPSTPGDYTAGVWSVYLDGSDIGLGTTGNIDAVSMLSDESLLISTTGKASVPGVSKVVGSDVLRFTPAELGDTTSGTWSMYLRGAAVGLTTAAENIDALDVVEVDGSVILRLSTQGKFSVKKLSGSKEDVFSFNLVSPGVKPSGTFLPSLTLDGSLYSLSGFNLVGVQMVNAAPPTTAGADAALLQWPDAAPDADVLATALGASRTRKEASVFGAVDVTLATYAV